jgi:two-component system, OmpR family, sensor histidine kinase KdpD
MLHTDDARPDPDALLRILRREEAGVAKGALKVFIGMCAGVGKTYAMLESARAASSKGVDLVVGVVETHGRKETESLLTGLETIPRLTIEYKGASLQEMDIDAILARRPALVLVDELAHTNAPGSRHPKRYQDVLELLDNGIDVYTTVNVQHLESRADTVTQITGAIIRETVPDSIFDLADAVEVIDIPPDELLVRLNEGKVYSAEQSQRAIEHFFRKGNLTALREMSLRIAAERVEHQLHDYMQANRITGPWKVTDRLLMGISPSPTTVRLIRWARRMASNMNASWIAVYVEHAQPLRGAQQEQLRKNIDLARELGAEIMTTEDEDTASALLRVAREQNATQILVGKPGARVPFRKTILDRLLAGSGDIDIHVVGADSEMTTGVGAQALLTTHSSLAQYLSAPGIIAIAAGACLPFRDTIGYQTAALVFLLIVSLLPLRFGVGPVLAAATFSALLWDFLFIPPQFTFAIGLVQDVLMFLAYFAIASVSGVLTARIRVRERALRVRERRSSALYALTNDLAGAHSPEGVAAAAAQNLRTYFGAEVCIMLSDPDGDFVGAVHPDSTYTPDAKEQNVPAWVHWNEQRAGRFTGTLPAASATYYPLLGPRYTVGVIGIRLPGEHPPHPEQDALLENFMRQIALAIDREFLHELTKNAVVHAESERLYAALFNSISHEMRTPITAILGASEALQEPDIDVRPGLRKELAGEILSATTRLDRIIHSLLSMTRLESGLVSPSLDWCDIGDIIRAATQGAEFKAAQINIKIEDDLPLLRLDFSLVEQAIANIIRNAVMHTPEGSVIEVRVFRRSAECLIVVEDNGPGIPIVEQRKIFDKFYRISGARTGGIGLGLSIADGFVRAHKGTITVANRAGGGAQFTISLPLHINQTGS